jgi:hypothetical protein
VGSVLSRSVQDGESIDGRQAGLLSHVTTCGSPSLTFFWTALDTC